MGARMKIKFKEACDGYEAGSVHEMDAGMADAYVFWRKAAEYAKDESSPVKHVVPMDDELASYAAKAIGKPARDKIIHSAPSEK
jgi:uncharacterized damage-inducible protein DinB